MGITSPRPLQKEDDSSLFDCGRESLNRWFQRHAWRNQATDVSRTNVVCDSDTGQIVGYVTLANSSLQRGFLAKSHQRNMPDPLPVALLGQLAVDVSYQRRGIASSLLFFAYRTVLEASKHVGCTAIITHPLDDSVRAFYAQHGFVDTAFDPDGSMIVRLSEIKELVVMH